MRDVLRKLREQGKFLFLATNSHFEYMELIMSTTLGEDWRQFFDMVCANSRKPLFFSGTQPFWKCNPSLPDFKESLVNLAEQVEGNEQTYLEGNAKLVAQVASLKTGVKEPRVCFFGDQYTSDC